MFQKLKNMFYELKSAKISRGFEYSVSATPLTANADVPPEVGDAQSRP